MGAARSGRGVIATTGGGGGGGGGGSGGGSVALEEELRCHLRVPANFVPAPSPCSLAAVLERCVRCDGALLRPADPAIAAAAAASGSRLSAPVVVEDGAFITAAGGADAVALATSFCARVEEAGRSF